MVSFCKKFLYEKLIECQAHSLTVYILSVYSTTCFNAELQLINLGIRSPLFGTFRERGVLRSDLKNYVKSRSNEES